MGKCHHDGNHHQHEHSDNWTKLAALGEAVSSFISDAYWLGGIFDVATGCNDDALGLSYYAIAFGAVAALLSASGAAYCHYNLNTLHQSAMRSSDHVLVNERQPLLGESVSLTNSQRLALIGDYLSHTGDIAGPLAFVVTLATGNHFTRAHKGIVCGVASFFGGICSVANVRTCANAMRSERQATSMKY